jgi:ParB family chromosome partitioning protein
MAKVRYREISPELEKLASPVSSQNSRVSIGFEDEVGEFYYFSVDDLIPYKNQARSMFDEDEIDKLSETIKQHGVRQPLSIIKSTIVLDKYEVVSGERRLRAARKAGLKKVPCIVIKDENTADEISLIENIQRQDLHPIELARAINYLVENKPRGAKSDIGKRIGLSRSQISELGSYLSLTKEVQDELLKHNVRGREHYRKLLSTKLATDQLLLLNSILNTQDGSSIKTNRKQTSRSVIRISIVDGILKVQSYSLNKITQKERQDVKHALVNIVEQLER